VQAFEDCLKEQETQQECIDGVTAQLTEINDRILFHRIGIEIGYIDKNTPPPDDAEQTESVEQTDDVEQAENAEQSDDGKLMLTVLAESDEEADEEQWEDEFSEHEDEDSIQELNLLEGTEETPDEPQVGEDTDTASAETIELNSTEEK